ncbi:glycoside hydrolase family protein [Verrucomicrobiota bacterium]
MKKITLFCLMMVIALNVSAAEWHTNLQERLEFLGIVLEDRDYHIWGSSPIWGDDGKIHLFVARFPVDRTHSNHAFHGWRGKSEIAHYIADKPEGPFVYKETLLKPNAEKKTDWGTGTQHNPSVAKAGDKYVLVYISDGKGGMGIGMMVADDINGPWKNLGRMLEKPEDPNVWSCGKSGTNPVFIHNPNNGKYYIYYNTRTPDKISHFGVAVADKLEGPYVHHPRMIMNNKKYIEDPCGFYFESKFYLLFREGFWVSSDDGVSFDNKIEAYSDKCSYYIDKEIVDKSPAYRGPNFQRPQLLLKDGEPSYLYAPSGVNTNGGDGSCCYLFRIKPDEE